MQIPENENSRALVKRLAALLSKENGGEILTTLQLLRQPYLRKPEPERTQPADKLGIWKLDPRDGKYHRDENQNRQWSFWAEQDSFPLKKAGRRVVLLGESAARAWFYDPVLTLGSLLGDYLAAGSGESCEVIDLARTDMNAFEVGQLAQDVAGLEPDAVVLFAGNNWLNLREYTQNDIQDVIDGFDRGFDTARTIFEERVLPRACRRVLGQLDSLPCQKIVVIPEFNLGGWRPFIETTFPIADYPNPTALLEALPLLAEAWQQENWQGLYRLCDEVESQTGKKSALAFYYRGRALQRQGRIAEAIEQLELAKDAPIGIEMPSTPRCPTIVQRTLRERGKELGMKVVDLPALFRGPSSSTVPGEDFFLDYCHLTLRGLHILARNVAAEFLRTDIADRYSPAKEVGVAYFLAALHSAHYGQDKITLRRQLGKSIEIDPSLKETLAEYLDFQSSATPRWVHRAYTAAIRNSMVERYFNRSQPGEFDKFADYQIYDVIADLLAATPAERSVYSEKLARSAGHAAKTRVDLLQDRFASETIAQYWMDNTAAFYKAHVTRSTFFLPMAGHGSGPEGEWRLEWLARLPPRNALGDTPQLTIAINGKKVATASLSSEWQNGSCRLDGESLVSGVNRITVDWPASFPRWDDFVKEYRRCSQVGEWPQALPTFGELFRFEVIRSER